MKKEVLPLISSSKTPSNHSVSKPFEHLKPWLDPKLFTHSLPPILLTGVDKAQSSITCAALGLSVCLSNSQSQSRHSHKADQHKQESPRPKPRANAEAKDSTPKKQKQCNCRSSQCLKLKMSWGSWSDS